MSVRQISQMAGTSASSIYHHFGSLEHLFLASQQACVAQAQSWCDQQIEQLDGFAGSPESFAGFFAYIVDEWTQACRPLAFARRECALMAGRSAQFREQEEQWRALWADFWGRASRVFALGASTAIVERIFDSESLLHMLRWRRTVDQAALEETARGLAAWLAGKPAPAAPWREFAQAQAMRSLPAARTWDEKSWQILKAAEDMIAVGGATSITHRSVAERAGVSLGTVSHRFRTKSALLEAAFEGIYTRLVTRQAEPREPSPPASTSTFIDNVAQAVLRDRPTDASDDLVITAARDAELRSLGAQLRYLRGRTSRLTLQSLIGNRRTVNVLEGALFSSFLSAQFRRYAGSARANTAAELESELKVLTDLLGA